MHIHDPIRRAVRLALAAGAVSSLAAVPQLAQAQDDEDVADQGLITVTGSRIQRVDIEGPSPVSVISRDDIEATGDISVAEVLRGSTFNQFGSFKTRSGSSAQGTSVVSLRGLGATRTLILLDGRRISGSPAFGAGSAQNLNTIPMDAVERIEVLRDGASAIYGSDAIGGVINVILRKDYEGLQMSAHVGRPTQSGGDEESYGLVGGISSGKGNITFSLDHEEREIIFNGDRSFSAVGLSAFGFPPSFATGTSVTAPVMLSGGGVLAGTEMASAANPAFVGFGTFADPRCPASLGTDPNFPDSVFGQFGTSSLCQFNYAATSASESSIQRDSFFVNGNFQVTENVGFFGRGLFTKVDTFGRYAPTPFTAPSPTISAANPLNPTNPAISPALNPLETQTVLSGTDYSEFDLDGDGIAEFTGPFPVTLYYRNVAGGFRDALNEDTLLDFLAGFNGTLDLMGGMGWELAAQHSKGISDQTSEGLGFASTLDNRIDAAEAFAGDPAGLAAAIAAGNVYDVFGLAGPSNFDAVVPSAVHTGLSDYEHRVASVDGQVTFDLMQMPSGPLATAIGFEYRDEKFLQNFDAQQNAANVAGSAGAADTSGARVAKSLFAELAIPVVDIVEVSLAGRYDDYNDFGTTFNPKVAVGMRPIDSVLLRASYGEGFRAPSMSQLYSAPVQSFNNAVDRLSCNAAPTPLPNPLPANHPCASTQYQNFSGGNTMLEPELSESFNVGVVWNPLDDLSMSFDYFDIEVTDQIATLPLQAILDAEAAMGSSPLVIRNARGQISIILANNQNIAGTKTKGYDVDVQYGFSLGAVGDFQSQLQVSKVIKYLVDQGDGLGFRRLQGSFDPDLRAALSLGWSRGDFSASVVGNHVTDTVNDDPLNMDGTVNTGFARLSSLTTWDVTVGWATPWNGEITLGARNVFDRDPPTNTALGNPNYSPNLHDVFGRVPFIRYEQNL